MKIPLNKKISLVAVSLFTLCTLAFSAPALAATGLEMPSGFTQTSASDAFIPKADTVTDVTYGYWAYDDINVMLATKALNGYPDRTFRPEKAVTRAELAAAISGAMYLSKAKIVELSDVSKDHWAAQSISNALPYMAAYADGFFRPDAPATREEVAVALVKATGLDKNVVDPTYIDMIFKDYKTVSPDLKDLVAIAVDKKLIKGYKVVEAGGQYDYTPGVDNDEYNLYINAQYFVTRAELANSLNTARKACSMGYKIPGGKK